MVYDSEKARSVARQVSNLSREIQQMSRANVRRMQSMAADALIGDAGDALKEELAIVDSRTAGLTKGLDQIAAVLFAYARQLEEIDRKAKELVQSR